ncbi:MAG: ATP cone domain-containing protein, partial [Candidatus Yonathbacteria bacterium]|nr:ATP cone domain-containing protein [Candidatus Yonathbacteria bacterium]
DGTVVSFDITRISDAVAKAMKVTGEGNEFDAHRIAEKVVLHLYKSNIKDSLYTPLVEEIQDTVERELIWEDFADTAKAYILYREKRAQARAEGVTVPEHVRKLTEESSKYFRNQLAEFVFYRTYARWIEKEGRRETWIETVDRYMDFMKENLGDKLAAKEYKEVREAILNHEAMPSMRLLQFAGPATRRTNVCAYNCSFIAPTKLQDFGEIMYILMCGTGAGFAAESYNVQQLPQIKFQTGKKLPTHVIPDTKEGWADSLVYGMKTWFAGKDVDFDFSKLRAAGAKLKTMGGRSSGPEPLRSVLSFARAKILKKQGRRLSNIDVHDIICKIGEVVVAGGVRRSALISLSDLDDVKMRDAKKGQFYLTEPQRSMANNSAVYMEKPTNEEFLDEWIALMKSGSGERGIFNRGSLHKTLPERRLKTLKGDVRSVGTNPCGEILLQSKQFCNLSEVVARSEDTKESLLRKIRVATILGTYQSTLTYFPYLSKEWKENCEKERLLGVSITGQWDSSVARDPEVLAKLKEETIKMNKKYAERFGTNQSTCITAVKPSGTLSQLVDSSSGMHPRHSEYYIRRVRIAAHDPLFAMMKEQGILYYPEVGQSMETANTYVLEFPIKAPANSIFKNDLSAFDQLDHWKKVKQSYTEHNPSITISVGENEWVGVAHWLYENWDLIGGLSFLPRDNHVYQLAPYEAIDKKRYDEMVKRFGKIDFSKIVLHEKSDATEVKKELACVAGVCEI